MQMILPLVIDDNYFFNPNISILLIQNDKIIDYNPIYLGSLRNRSSINLLNDPILTFDTG